MTSGLHWYEDTHTCSHAHMCPYTNMFTCAHKQAKNKPRAEDGTQRLVRPAQGSPVYWPWKETLSFRLMLPDDLVPSRAAWGCSSKVLLFPDDSREEKDSDSEPVVEREPQKGWVRGSNCLRSEHAQAERR